jgi:hypothetical protein
VPTRVESDIKVQRFTYANDAGHRLIFPRAELQKIEGRSGGVQYGVEDGIFDGLEGRISTVRWTADAASFGSAWMRDDTGRFQIDVNRIEMSRGLMLTRAESGVEIVSPHVSLSEMRLTVKGPFGRTGSPAPAPASPPDEVPTLRQDRLRFLDSLSGRIYLTVKVVLDLPVIKKRTLDQQLKIPIQEGSLDFRALEESLDWLEGAFLDITHEKDKLAIKWKVPIFGGGRDLIAWKLDDEAETMAAFGRVPVRSLTDVRRKPRAADANPDQVEDDKRKTLQSLTVEAIDVALSLLAPRSLEVGGGLIMFGGDEQPGMVDLKVTGSINDRGPGSLIGTIGSVDTTIKDLRIGPMLLTADRLHFDGLDQLEVTFDGFRPSKVTMVVHRVTATNLYMRLGGKR